MNAFVGIIFNSFKARNLVHGVILLALLLYQKAQFAQFRFGEFLLCFA